SSRLPRPALGAASAWIGGTAPQHRRPPLLPAARSLEAALGAMAGPGPRAEPLRPDHEDAPRAGRRGLGGRHRNGSLPPEAGAGADRAGPRLVPAPSALLGRARRPGHRRSGAYAGAVGAPGAPRGLASTP